MKKIPDRNPAAVRDGLYPCDCGGIATHSVCGKPHSACDRCYRLYLARRHSDQQLVYSRAWNAPREDGYDHGPETKGNAKEEEWIEVRRMRAAFVERQVGRYFVATNCAENP